MNTLTSSKDQSVLDFLTEKLMQTQTENQTATFSSTRKLSQQVRAVLLIFNTDPYLMEAVTSYINLETESI